MNFIFVININITNFNITTFEQKNQKVYINNYIYKNKFFIWQIFQIKQVK